MQALVALPLAVAAEELPGRQALAYTATSIVNLANGQPGDLAPNTLAAVYGSGFSTRSRARLDSDVAGDQLPIVLPGTGVTVNVNGLLAPIEYVAPDVVIFLVPSELQSGPAVIVVTRNAESGPAIDVELRPRAPAFFLYEDGQILARHTDTMEWVTKDAPARPGETVILYAGGLGVTTPLLAYRRMPAERLLVERASEWRVSIDGVELPAAAVEGPELMPGFPGLYEVRFRLPANVGLSPEIRLRLDDGQTQAGLHLPVSPEPLEPAPVLLRTTK